MSALLYISSLRMELVRNVQNIKESKEMEKFAEQTNVLKNKRLISRVFVSIVNRILEDQILMVITVFLILVTLILMKS